MVNKTTFDKYRTFFLTHQSCTTAVPLVIKTKKDIPTYNELVMAVNQMRSEFVPAKPQYIVDKAKFDETEVMVLSDLHFGKLVELEGEVKFDKRIAEERFKSITASMLHLNASYMSNHKMDELVILLLGDIVDGEIIYEGQVYNQDMSLLDQVSLAARLIKKELIDPVSQLFNRVRIVSVPGNHGEIRNQAGVHMMHPRTNFDTVVALMLQMGCQDLKNVEFEIATTNLHTTMIRGWKFLLAHNLPSATSSGFRKKYGGYFERFRFDVSVHGHWHTPEWTYFNTKPIVQNGSLPGTDDYAVELAFNTVPLQVMFTVSDKRPVALRWEVDVGHRIKEADVA